MPCGLSPQDGVRANSKSESNGFIQSSMVAGVGSGGVANDGFSGTADVDVCAGEFLGCTNAGGGLGRCQLGFQVIGLDSMSVHDIWG